MTTSLTPTDRDLLTVARQNVSSAKQLMDMIVETRRADIIEVRQCVSKANAALLELERRMVLSPPQQQQADRP